MTTWISNAALAGVCLSLSACDGVETASFLGGLMPSGPVENVALAQTQMADGAFALLPPDGFCIDKDTLRQSFALMVRCDALGAPSRAGGTPVGLITVSVTALAQDDALPSAQDVADAAALSGVGAERASQEALTFFAEGKPPARSLDKRHWRGMARVGDHMLGVALYGPQGGRAVSEEGRDVLLSLIRRTSAGS